MYYNNTFYSKIQKINKKTHEIREFFYLKKFGINFGVFWEYFSQLSFFLCLFSWSGTPETNNNKRVIMRNQMIQNTEFFNEIILIQSQKIDSPK